MSGTRKQLYELAARELSMNERPEFVRNAVDVVLERADLSPGFTREELTELVHAANAEHAYYEDEGDEPPGPLFTGMDKLRSLLASLPEEER